MANEFLEFKWR